MQAVTHLRIIRNRLLFTCPDLRGAPHGAAATKPILHQLSGVERHTVSSSTGRVLVEFDADAIGADRILQALGIEPSLALTVDMRRPTEGAEAT